MLGNQSYNVEDEPRYHNHTPRTNYHNANVYKQYTEPPQQVYYETQIPYSRNRFKDFIAFIITIICIICIGFLLWKIPFTNQFIVGIYEENNIIKAIVDFFLGLF